MTGITHFEPGSAANGSMLHRRWKRPAYSRKKQWTSRLRPYCTLLPESY